MKMDIQRSELKRLFLGIAIFQFLIVGLIWAQDVVLVYGGKPLFLEDDKKLSKQVQAAESLIEDNKQMEAIRKYEQIVKVYPAHLKSWKRLAQLYSWNNMGEKAISCYKKIIELDPVDTEAKKTLAQYYIWNNRQLEAIELLEKVVMFEPDNIELRRQLAQLYSWNNMPDKAIKEYEAIVRSDSTDTTIIKLLANNYFWTNRPLKGIKMLERVVALEPDSLNFRKQLAQQYIWNEMPQQAIVQYEEILKRDPEDGEILEKLAQQYIWNNRSKEAAKLYEKLVGKKPDNLNFNMQLARAYQWSNQGEKAEKPLQEVLKQQPYNKEALLSLAELQRWSGRWDMAKDNLEKLLQIDPKNQKARQLLAGIREEYGTVLYGRYYRISDSNQIIREEIPIVAKVDYNHHWQYQFAVKEYRVKDERLDSLQIGYHVQARLKYNFSPRTSTFVKLGLTNYSSGWTPFSFKIQLNQSFFNRIYTNFQFYQTETREGVRALTDRIVIHGVMGELFWQINRRLSCSGTYQRHFYSDNNDKLTTSTGINYSQKIKASKLILYGYYVYEDFRNIYPSSFPYWTPEQLSTISLGVNLTHNFNNWLYLGWGYALTNQQGIYSNNFSGEAMISLTKYDRISFQYLKNGSKIYHAESYNIFFQHRF